MMDAQHEGSKTSSRSTSSDARPLLMKGTLILEKQNKLFLGITNGALSKITKKWTGPITRALELRSRATVVAITGSSGEGKSSLLNAILGETNLIPTSGMSACTAALTEVAYNHHDGDPYRAVVHFISEAEWREELEVMTSDLLQPVDDPDGPTEADLVENVAVAKLQAVYPFFEKHRLAQQLSQHSVASLLKNEKVATVLGKSIKSSASDGASLGKQIEKYVKSVKDSRGPTDGVFQYFPLVKKIQIFTKSEVLRTGAILGDVPGYNDTNAARVAVAQKYIQDCAHVWVVADINRAATNQFANQFILDRAGRQLVRDSMANNIAFVCTKTDIINDEEIRHEFVGDKRFDELMADHNQTISQHERDIRALEAKIDDAKDQVKKLAEQDQALKAEKHVISKSIAAARRGEVINWLGSDVPGNSKRARVTFEGDISDNAAELRAKRPCHETQKPDTESPDDEMEMMSSSSITATDRRTMIETENTDHQTTSSTDAKDILYRLENEYKRLDQAIEATLAEERETKLTIFGDRQLIDQHELGIDAAESRILAECVRQRNQASKLNIQNSFAKGMQELSTGNGKINNEDDLRNPINLPTLPVFCVSSTGYQALKGRRRNDRRDTCRLTNLDDTGIPELQQYVQETALAHRQAAEKAQLNEMQRILQSLNVWASAGPSADFFDGARISRSNPVSSFAKKVCDEISNFVQRISQEVEANLSSQIFKAVPHAADVVHQLSRQWGLLRNQGGFPYRTYRAILVRDGDYVTPKRSIRLKNSISDPFLTDIDPRWTRVFNGYVPRLHSSINANIQHEVQVFEGELSSFVKKMKLNKRTEKEFRGHFQTFITSLQDRITRHAEQINDDQKRINRLPEPLAKAAMLNTYAACKQESGSGTLQRYRDHIENALSPPRGQNKQRKIANTMRDELRQSIAQAGADLTQAVEELCDELKDVTGILAKSDDSSFYELPAGARDEVKALLTEAVEAGLITPIKHEARMEEEADSVERRRSMDADWKSETSAEVHDLEELNWEAEDR